MANNNNIIIGIDLGTTNSVVSYMQADGKWKVIPSPEGKNTCPSVVAFKASGEEIVGDAAKRQMVTNPDTVYSIKRKIVTGQKTHINCLNKDLYSDPGSDMNSLQDQLSYSQRQNPSRPKG